MTAEKPKIRHEWFQNDQFVTISVYIKNVDPSTIKLNIVPEALSLSIKYPTTGSEYALELDLCHPIDPKQSTHTVLKTQVEIKLKKVSAIAWKSLEASQITCPNMPKPKKNWDQLAKEIEAEKEEDTGINTLFQKIFADGDENTRKAMMKSFSESGGTCLSTNWDEIGKKRTEITPPEGMEARRYGA